MAKRKTEDDYRRLAESRGLEWHGPAVRTTKDKTWWECKTGHKWEAVYTHIRNGSGCPTCSGCARKTKDDYNNLAAKRGFKWLDDKVPPNNSTKTVWECSRGHQWRARYNAIQRGCGCPFCANRIPKTPADYYTLATKRRFKWLGPIVSRVTIKTGWECDRGHQWKAPHSSIQRGIGCPVCAGNMPKTPKDYKLLAEQRQFKWVGPKVPNIQTKTIWKCENGHQWEARYSHIQQGIGCPHCAGLFPKTASDYHTLATTRGFQWTSLEIPSNVIAKTTWECDKGHRWETSYTSVRLGHDCPICLTRKRSIQQKARWASGIFDGVFQSPTSIEIKIAQALDNLGLEHHSQYRPDGYSRIFDEFIPSINTLIEIQGTFWHGPQNPQNQKRDVEKAKWAKEQGYHLVTIWENEIKTHGAEALIRKYVLPLLK